MKQCYLTQNRYQKQHWAIAQFSLRRILLSLIEVAFSK